MIDRGHDLPIARRGFSATLWLGLLQAASGFSGILLPQCGDSDQLHLECPFAGSRRRGDLSRWRCRDRPPHVATLMKRMGIRAIYRRRNTSKPAPGHKIYPYLLRGVKVERPNQVWACDITYIPMRAASSISSPSSIGSPGGFFRIGCRSQMEVGFCVEARRGGLRQIRKPD